MTTMLDRAPLSDPDTGGEAVYHAVCHLIQHCLDQSDDAWRCGDEWVTRAVEYEAYADVATRLLEIVGPYDQQHPPTTGKDA